jgi:hypothetical protein
MIRDRLGTPVDYIKYMGWFRRTMMHTRLIRISGECFRIYYWSLEMIRDRLVDPGGLH